MQTMKVPQGTSLISAKPGTLSDPSKNINVINSFFSTRIEPINEEEW